MPRTKKRSSKTGLPPGTVMHIGERKTDQPVITILDYNDTDVEEKQALYVEECFPFKEKDSVTWINVEGLHQTEIIKKIGAHFGMHPLLQEDIANTEQRPKVDYFEHYVVIIAKMLRFDEQKKTVVSEQVSLVLGKNFVISFQEGMKGDVFDTVRDRIRKGRFAKRGADYLMYSLLDAIVDKYFDILEKLGEHIEFLEEELIQAPTLQTLQQMYHLKTEMIYLRKSVWPLREVLSSLQRSETHLIDRSIHFYLRDVYDHTVQVIDTLETFRDMLSGMLEIYLSSMSNRLNEVMKVLTIIGTIFIPLTFVTSLYGMNFRFMPELQWKYGYFATLGIMTVVTIFMLFYFKRKKWL